MGSSLKNFLGDRSQLRYKLVANSGMFLIGGGGYASTYMGAGSGHFSYYEVTRGSMGGVR